MGAERKHAYAVRLQCWWRGILAVRTKTRTRRSLNETPLAEVEGGQESAAIAIQVCCGHIRSLSHHDSGLSGHVRSLSHGDTQSVCSHLERGRSC